ncbi:hypothetical protein EZS27_023351 [termite gut metagenome]|uniref:DUF4038 domain-containing protein n=1 Tax=termite gut metagenome TaxID=433724 RepID=A0A5J4R3Y3_9ZZZZ
MKKIIVATIVVLLFFLAPGLRAQTSKHGAIVVHPEKRFLQYADGTPFFYLGDTAWELFHRLNIEDARKYLTDRAMKGYTVIQAVALAEHDGLKTPNTNGDLPFVDANYTIPNEAYFKHIDAIINLCDSLGMVVGLLPAWGDKMNKAWGVGPVIFDNEKSSEAYGNYIGKRYKNCKNIIWILGGDRDYTGYEPYVRAMAKGIAIGISGKEDYSQCLMTLHPSGSGTSAKWFHNDEWLDFNMQQNGHCYDVDVWDRIQRDYNLMPTKPILDGEPLYDEHPICFDRNKNGTSTDFHTRRFFYHEVFSGAFGHTQGCHAIWQMWTPDKAPINGPVRPWYESIHLLASSQMGYGRYLMESRPFFSRIPDQSIVVEGQREGLRRISATRDKNGSYAMLYIEQGDSLAVNLQLLSGKKITAWWFDVRSGASFKIGTFGKTNHQWFYPPAKGKGNDWVLVLDDASKKYGAPGERK